MAWQSGGGGGGAAPFSGASVENINAGVVLASTFQAAPVFTKTLYDTASYLAGASHFVAPMAGYYAAVFTMQADAPFVGPWELLLAGFPDGPAAISGNSITGQVAEGQVYEEGHLASGASITFSMSQSSGSNQLVYPYARIHYLGS